ncbi:Tyrosine--tRNA ligase [compost metagenome]
MTTVSPESLESLLLGAAEVLPAGGLEAKLKEAKAKGRPLRVKLGFDPTKPDLHIGHAVVLWALRRFQDAGHQLVIIIGDFTARIGDPTGKESARPPLSKEDVEANATTYLEQLGAIIDLSKAEIRRNGEWLDTMDLTRAIRLMGQATVAQMLARENFALRYERGDAIGLHEFLYPLLQGQDSVEIKADVELGGTDQKFNNLMGRQLQENDGQAPQVVMLYPILEGVGTKEKMSKSLDNYIGLNDSPKDMFGKSMRITDEQMPQYYTLASGLPVAEIKAAINGLADGSLHPRDAKMNLGWAITKLYHGEAAANEAKDGFIKQFAEKELPNDIPDMTAASGTPIARLLVELKLAASTSEARRLLDQGGVKFHKGDAVETPKDPNGPVELNADGLIIQVGKRKFARVFAQAGY